MAAKRIENKVTVYKITRGKVSALGNPSYVFHTDRGQFKTQANSGSAYSLENDFPVNTTLDIEVTLICTGAGRVFDWRK